jgi:hypothetical protein
MKDLLHPQSTKSLYAGIFGNWDCFSYPV